MVGSSGQVGSKVASLAPEFGYHVFTTHNFRPSDFPNSTKLDVTDRNATIQLVHKLTPDVIINTAAMTNVDYCETHREEAEKVNVGGVRNLADAAQETRCRLVQISTDSVFDGTRGQYNESDPPSPINYYSVTKLESEAIVSRLTNFAIARPSVIYGWRPQTSDSSSTKAMNFAMFVLDRISKNHTVDAVEDQFSSPTMADNLAKALLLLGRISENGIFHTAGKSCVSRYQFATKICREFGFSTKLVRSVKSSEFEQTARRPKNCCLSVEKAETALGMRFLTIDEGISLMKQQALK